MPPTRGHDLKRVLSAGGLCSGAMPPTRGHDLKRLYRFAHSLILPDAPHTGARLETSFPQIITVPALMPPTRGHDLKHDCRTSGALDINDAPHTGARLETRNGISSGAKY